MPYASSGGWRAGLVRDRLTLGPDIPFLGSQRYTVKPSGATFKKTAAASDVNEVQTLASSGATAGTFTLSFGNYGLQNPVGYVTTTAPLAYTATAAQVLTALQGLDSIGVGNVAVTGGPANTTALVITFQGRLAAQDLGLIQIDKSGLTGGAAAAISETTRGAKQGFSVIKRGTFVHPDTVNVGYYKPFATGDSIVTDMSGFLMESINVADGDVTEGLMIQGVVRRLRVFPQPVPAAITTACAGRILFA